MRTVAPVYIVEHRNLTRSYRCKQSFKALKYSAIKRLLFLDTREDWKMHSRVKFRMYLKNLRNFECSTCGTGMY